MKTLREVVIPGFKAKHPGANVQDVAVPYDQLHQKLITSAAGADLPDVMRSDIIWVPELAKVADVFDGFHLDQYGYPRRAVRPDGGQVDVAEAFVSLIEAVRGWLPEAKLIFNNVNDFPVWATADAPQGATYNEPWEPHAELGDLAAAATRARLLAPGRPAIMAAYQSAYKRGDADLTTKLTMATLFSHGCTQLLAGEGGNILVDPYYVDNQVAARDTQAMLVRWYDFLVATGDLLLAPGSADITRSVAGSHNDEIDVHGAPTHHEPRAGTVWRRVVGSPAGQTVHLINLSGQDDLGWDTPKRPAPAVPGLSLRLRRTGSALPVVRVGDPDSDAGPELRAVEVTADGDHAVAALPPLGVWQVIHISRGETV
ncbi:extracellular solute-binding protein [Microtetraspora sp. NBRC 16547]|uniref:extracellular solute-binding protein n=1 Tax=Microtetraspora sp. NBRC 16547 TaxID=3030993 RepID=UPI0024A1C907|nr:extracellular solute-binding protein [Microtetraspora sp. NBRC 16547]GLW96772.1 hypothetical protein Misp02_08590 [Microtetraspora sp. NBRC 16547]